jgi:dehydrogenase/reductase SDR family member 12
VSSVDGLLDATVVAGFTRPGFVIRARHFDPLPAMPGKTVVVTGGTSGIGGAAAHALAALGARVVVVGRDRAKLDTTTAAIQGSGGEAIGLGADLGRLGEVRDLAARLGDLDGGVDVLVNNVSVLAEQRSITEDGIETTLATNLVCPFLLTNLLVPLLAASGAGRVVTVSSGGMYTQPLVVDDLEMSEREYDGAVAYARTKRAQVALTELWADRLRLVGVVAHAMHPGWVDTPGLAASLPAFHTLLRPILRDADQGADTIAFLSAAAEPGDVTGLFWHDRLPRPTHRLRRTRSDDRERSRLWAFLTARSGWVEPGGWPQG